MNNKTIIFLSIQLCTFNVNMSFSNCKFKINKIK